MSTTTDRNGNDFAGDAETTAEVPRPPLAPQSPQAPYGYGPYAAPQPAAWTPGYAPYGQAVPVPTAPKSGLSRNGRLAVAGGAAALVAAMAGVIVVGAHVGGGSTAMPSVSSTASSSAADPNVKMIAGTDLPQMLLNPAEVAAAVGLPGSERAAKVGKLVSAPWVDTIASNQECLALAYSAEQDAYQGTGFTAMRGQASTVRIPNSDAQSWFFSQGVFAYPTVDAAEKALLKNVATFKACEGQSWSEAGNADNGNRPLFWTVGSVNHDGNGFVTVQTSQENANGWGCWRALKTDANVVVDFTVCGLNKPESVPAALADAITAKLPTT